jgi:hypothetical protein
MCEIDTKIAKRLIGFRKKSLHFMADFIGEVAVLLFQYIAAYVDEMVLPVRIVAIYRFAGP